MPEEIALNWVYCNLYGPCIFDLGPQALLRALLFYSWMICSIPALLWGHKTNFISPVYYKSHFVFLEHFVKAIFRQPCNRRKKSFFKHASIPDYTLLDKIKYRECVNGSLCTGERCEVIKTCRVISMSLLISAARSKVKIDGRGFQKCYQEVGWYESSTIL